jgi:DNA repair protein RecO (recombination protein O)
MNGAPISLTGDSLLSAYYLNELLLNLLHRHDPQPEIFSAYHTTISELNGQQDIAVVLRRFEMELLRLLGYALNLDHDTETGIALDPDRQYEYRLEQGPVQVVSRDGPMVFTGAELIAVAREEFSDATTLKLASRLLRHVIAWHLDGKELKSRKVLKELRRGAQQQI